MQEPDKQLTEAQKSAVAFMTRPKPNLDAWRAARETEEKRAAEEKAAAAAKAEAEAIANTKVGDRMPDGTIYAGISPDTNQRMYAAPYDAPLSMNFNAAAEYTKVLKVGDKQDFRVPTKAELNVLFENREKGALKGTFNLTGSNPDGWYWSSTPNIIGDLAWGQNFSNGRQDHNIRYGGSSVRCVR